MASIPAAVIARPGAAAAGRAGRVGGAGGSANCRGAINNNNGLRWRATTGRAAARATTTAAAATSSDDAAGRDATAAGAAGGSGISLPRREALAALAATFPALWVGAANAEEAADVLGGCTWYSVICRADAPDADASANARASAAGAAQAKAEAAVAAEDVLVVGDMKLFPYVDVQSGWSIKIPEGWQKDTPKAFTPEFHPVSEYGGRRFRVEVAPVVGLIQYCHACHIIHRVLDLRVVSYEDKVPTCDMASVVS